MIKDDFLLMELQEQLDYINGRLLGGESMHTINSDLVIGKNTISIIFKEKGYFLDKTTKQYIKCVSDDKPVIKLDNKSKIKSSKKTDIQLDNRPDNRPSFNIPIKIKTKTTNKAFNVVMNEDLVNKLDKLCKEKGGYSRNELINKMCEYCIDTMN